MLQLGCSRDKHLMANPQTSTRKKGDPLNHQAVYSGRSQGWAGHLLPPGPSCPQVLENYNKGKTALLSAAKVMVSPTEVDLTPELIFQQQPLPTGPPLPTGLALELPATDHRNSSVR